MQNNNSCHLKALVYSSNILERENYVMMNHVADFIETQVLLKIEE